MNIKVPNRMAADWSGDGRDFRRALYRLLIGLGIVCAVLSLAVIFSGPRLRQVQIDTRAITSQAGQRVVLHTNQPLAKLSAAQVSIQPAVRFGVVNNADTITITLKEKLAYNTAYHVTIKGSAALYNAGRRADLHYTFITSNPTMYYLRRGGSFDRTSPQQDTIYRSMLDGRDEVAVYSAPRIQSFVVVDGKLAVVTIGNDKRNNILLVDPATGRAAAEPLPARGYVDQLHSSPDGSVYGFRFSDDRPPAQSQYQNNLYIHNPSPGHLMISLDGLGGKPLQIMQWQFAPDNTSVVAQTYDTNLMLVDTAYGHRPEALGQFKTMANFSADGLSLLVQRPTDFALLNIPQRNITTSKELAIYDSGNGVLLDARLLANRSGELLYAWRQDGAQERNSFSLWDGQAQKTVYEYNQSDYQQVGFGLTPNDQYLIVAGAAGAQDDGYPATGLPVGVQTKLIDTTTGKVVRTIDGSQTVLAD